MSFFNTTKAKIKSLPKWFRFFVFYGLSPIWFPIVFLVLLVILLVSKPIALVAELWRDFK